MDANNFGTPSKNITQRGLAVAAVAALGLGLAACGGNNNSQQQGQQPEVSVSSAPAAPTSQAAPSSAAPSSSAPSASTNGDIPASADVVNTAIDTAEAQLANSKAYDYEYDDNRFEIDVTDGKSERQVTIEADGTTVVETENDDLGDFLQQNRDEVFNAKVDMKQGLQVALNEQAGIPVSAELDKDRNLLGNAPDTLAWDIEIKGQDGSEADIVVDAVSAKVLSKEIDR